MKDLVATLALIRRNDELLLAMKKRGFGKGYWNGPGGKVEPDESLEQAMIRECQEEIGITPTHYYKAAEHTFILDSHGKPWRMYVTVYLCDLWEGEAVESEEMAPHWFQIHSIPYDRMWQDDTYWLPQVLKGKLVKTTFTFDAENNVLTHKVSEVEKL